MNTTTINHTLSSWLNFVVCIMYTPKLLCSILTRSTKKIENVKAIFSTVIILSLPLRFVSWWAQKAMFQVTKCYIERENHCKLHAWCNFFSSLQRLNSMDAWKYTCNSQTQSTQGVSNPCSYRIQILQYENMRGSCEFSKYFTRKQVR